MARKSAGRPEVRDPLAAIPAKPEQVEVRRDSHGMIHLRLALEPPGLLRHIVRWMHYDYTRKVELDEYGTAYYALVDGRTTLRHICAVMKRQFGKSRKETEAAVVLFTKKLMQMQMIYLIVPQAQTKDAQ